MTRCVLFDIDNTLLFKTPSIMEKVFTVLQPQQPALDYEEVERAYAQSEIWQGEQIRKENESGVRMADEEYLHNVFKVYEQALGLSKEAYHLLRPILMGDYVMAYKISPDAKETLLGAYGAIVSERRFISVE